MKEHPLIDFAIYLSDMSVFARQAPRSKTGRLRQTKEAAFIILGIKFTLGFAVRSPYGFSTSSFYDLFSPRWPRYKHRTNLIGGVLDVRTLLRPLLYFLMRRSSFVVPAKDRNLNKTVLNIFENERLNCSTYPSLCYQKSIIL